MKKLYIIVRADLSAGDLAAQTGHAVAAFARRHGIAFCNWFDGDNNLVVLSVPTEADLQALRLRVLAHGVLCCDVHEPDLGDSLTAIAADDRVARLVSSLPLALRAA
jgi:peptidyl-tRNA hydrolase